MDSRLKKHENVEVLVVPDLRLLILVVYICKQSKGVKICASIRRELDFEKFSETFCKLFTKQNMQKICKIK